MICVYIVLKLHRTIEFRSSNGHCSRHTRISRNFSSIGSTSSTRLDCDISTLQIQRMSNSLSDEIDSLRCDNQVYSSFIGYLFDDMCVCVCVCVCGERERGGGGRRSRTPTSREKRTYSKRTLLLHVKMTHSTTRYRPRDYILGFLQCLIRISDNLFLLVVVRDDEGEDQKKKERELRTCW